MDDGSYKDSVGRSYYAMFSAVRAILAKDEIDFSKHAGVIAYFAPDLTQNIIMRIMGIFGIKIKNTETQEI